MTVKLNGPAGGVIEVSDDAVDRYLAKGYSKVEAAKAPAKKPEPVKPERMKPRANARRGV